MTMPSVRPVPSMAQAPARRRLWLAGTAVLLLGITLAPGLVQSQVVQGQDAAAGSDDAKERRATVHVASLAYLPAGQTELVRIAARDVGRVQLVRSATGETMWLELFYHGGDYVLQKVDNLIFYRRDGTQQQVKIDVGLVNMQKIGFPLVN